MAAELNSSSVFETEVRQLVCLPSTACLHWVCVRRSGPAPGVELLTKILATCANFNLNAARKCSASASSIVLGSALERGKVVGLT